MDEEMNERRGRSAWFTLDILVLLCVLGGTMFFGMYLYYRYAMLAAFAGILVVLLCAGRYRTDEKPRRKAGSAVLRTLLYLACAVALLLPLSLSWDWKAYYPIQKCVYGMNADAEKFLPDRIPDNAEDYEALFCRSVFPGASRIILQFYTDSETIAAYRARALGYGAVTTCDAAPPSRFAQELAEHGVSMDSAEFYYYPGASDHFPRVYILEETTGFVMIYY